MVSIGCLKTTVNLLMLKFIYTVLCIFLLASAKAVIVAGGDGMQNTNAPTGGQGWDYVGRITSANGAPSGVTYISNNWFITAYHIKALDNPTGVLLGGAPYAIDPNSWTRLKNSTNGDADLIMFRVVGATVGLPALKVRSSNLPNNSNVTMIGNGRNRDASETSWSATWVEDGKPTFYRGYKWASGTTKRWGTNVKDADAGLVNSGGSLGVTDMYYTDFDRTGGTGDEAQGATYDSGGGVFYDNGSEWELAGIMVTVGNIYSGQPWPPSSDGTAVYGNLTLMANMQYYAAQISSTAEIDDIDEDGIPDGWEYEHSGSSTGVVASTDQDGDGYTGEEEWVADTAPLNSNSFLRVADFPGATNVVFASSTNREYQIQYLTNLTNDIWAAEVDWFEGSHSQTVHSVSSGDSNRFYRVRARLK